MQSEGSFELMGLELKTASKGGTRGDQPLNDGTSSRWWMLSVDVITVATGVIRGCHNVAHSKGWSR